MSSGRRRNPRSGEKHAACSPQTRERLARAFAEPAELLPLCRDLLSRDFAPEACFGMSRLLDELAEARAFGLARHQKDAGLHYTPQSLVERIASRVFANVERAGRFTKGAILDPACGSGRFLVASLAQLLKRGLSPRESLDQIVGFDLDAVAVEVTRARLWLEACARLGRGDLETSAKIRCADALTVECSAALVLGNPPFRSPGGRAGPGARLGGAGLPLVGQELRGRRSLALEFLVRASRWLVDGGTLAFVLPDTLLINQNFTEVRRALVSKGWLEESWIFRKPVFKKASVGAALWIWHKEAGGASALVEIEDHRVEPWRERRWTCEASQILAHPRCRLDGREAVMEPLLGRSGFVALGERCEIRDGINTGSAGLRKRLLAPADEAGEDLRVELLDGQCIHPFAIDPVRWKLRSIEISHAERRAGASLRRPEVFRSPRLVYRQTADRPIVAIEREARWTLNSVHNLLLKDSSIPALQALCGWLNSEIGAKIYRELSGETRRDFPQVHVATMRLLPVPEAVFQVADRRTRQMIELVAELEAQRPSGSGRDESLRRQLERLCEELYQEPRGLC